MSEEKTDVFEYVKTLLNMLPPQFQAWAIIVLLVVGGIWWWRKSGEEKEPSSKVKQKTKGKNSPAINNVKGNVEINSSKKDK